MHTTVNKTEIQQFSWKTLFLISDPSQICIDQIRVHTIIDIHKKFFSLECKQLQPCNKGNEYTEQRLNRL